MTLTPVDSCHSVKNVTRVTNFLNVTRVESPKIVTRVTLSLLSRLQNEVIRTLTMTKLKQIY